MKSPQLSLFVSIFTLFAIISGSIYCYMIPHQSIIITPLPTPSPITQDAIIVPMKRIYDPTHTGIISEEYNVRGVSMQPMIENGDTVKVDLNYYNSGQHLVKSGDVVVFENPFSLTRIIKRVVMIPGDRVAKDLKNRTLLVNGITLVNSLGESYIFDDRSYRWVDIYTKSGVIMPNTYYLYGDNIENSVDSRQTGPVTIEGILGKVTRIKSQENK